MVIEVLIGVSPEGIAIVVTAVAVCLKVEVQIDQRVWVVRADMLEAPEHKGVGIEGIEGAN